MLLGLDLGTTNIKGFVTDYSGRAIARASIPVDVRYLSDGGVEQDIEQIVSATLQVIRHLTQKIAPRQIESVGISSQGGALQLLSSKGKPVGPVISWMDGRGQPFDEEVKRKYGKKWLEKRIGRRCSGLAIGQILRLRKIIPRVFDRRCRIGFVGDIVVSRLCGCAAQDGTSCGLTLLYNPWAKRYDADVLALLGLEPDQLPALISPREPAGHLLPAMARKTGLRAGIPISAAIHDQYAAALGSGVVVGGSVMIGTGTAWVLLAVNTQLRAPVTDQAFICGHVAEKVSGQILSLVNGGSCFAWALDLIRARKASRSEIDRLLDSSPPGSHGLMFWPFLTTAGVAGLPTDTRGRLSGIQLSHTSGDVLRSVIEGLAFELKRHLQFLTDGGWPTTRLIVGGGAAASLVTTQILADVTGLAVLSQPNRDVSLLGAAIIAKGLLESKRSLVEISRELVPTPIPVEVSASSTRYQDKFQEYLQWLPCK